MSLQSRRLSLRLSEELFQALQVEAARAGFPSLSDYARRRLAAEPPLREIRESLARIETRLDAQGLPSGQTPVAAGVPELRYDHGRLEVRDPGETLWREQVHDGQHHG